MTTLIRANPLEGLNNSYVNFYFAASPPKSHLQKFLSNQQDETQIGCKRCSCACCRGGREDRGKYICKSRIGLKTSSRNHEAELPDTNPSAEQSNSVSIGRSRCAGESKDWVRKDRCISPPNPSLNLEEKTGAFYYF